MELGLPGEQAGISLFSITQLFLLKCRGKFYFGAAVTKGDSMPETILLSIL
jgi:hypothetical protein